MYDGLSWNPAGITKQRGAHGYDGATVCASDVRFAPPHSTGKERDTESGNDYFEARYYSSAMGRFMSPDWSAKEDPVPYATMDNPQSLNLYSYVKNNPLSHVDADGHFCDWTDVGQTFGGIINALHDNNFGNTGTSLPENSLGRSIGNVLSVAQGLGQIVGGSALVAGGGAEAGCPSHAFALSTPTTNLGAPSMTRPLRHGWESQISSGRFCLFLTSPRRPRRFYLDSSFQPRCGMSATEPARIFRPLDEYQVTTDKRSEIVNDPNREDDPEYIVRPIGQVITVSLETVRLVNELSTTNPIVLKRVGRGFIPTAQSHYSTRSW